MLGDHAKVDDAPAALGAALAAVRREGALTVLATTLTLDDAERRLPLKDVDVLLIRAKYEMYVEPQLRGSTLVLQPGSRGMRLGRIDIERAADGRIVDWHHEEIGLPFSQKFFLLFVF